MLRTLCRLVAAPVSRNIALGAFLIGLALVAVQPGLSSEAVRSPLAPPDTSSPGATLKSFRDSMEAAYRAAYVNHDVPIPQSTPAQVRATRTLDTRQLPRAEAYRLAAEAAILLNEALDHVALPAFDEISDVAALRAAAGGGAVIYRIPDTDIAIVEIVDGPKKGEFLFSAETVDQAMEFYEASRPMAPRPGSMKGLYRLITTAPGHLISRAWIERLPDWAKQPFLGEAVWKWFAVVPIICIWGLAVVYGYRRSRSREGHNRLWLRFFLAVGAVGLTFVVIYLLKHQFILLGTVFKILDTGFIAAAYIIGAFALVNLGRATSQSIIAKRQIDPHKIDAHLIGVSFRAAAWVLVIILLSVGASRLGIPIEAVIASVGVGGFAAVLAARPTLENLIAGVTLYLDKPVRVGEYCMFDDVVGAVEHIGLRSTRLRLWGGSLVSMPNSHFADLRLENLNNMNYILFRGHFGLRLETTPDQLRFVLAKLREMLFAHPKVKWPRARLTGFDQHAMKLQLIAYVDTINWGEYHAIREDIYIRSLEIIDDAGTGLSVPATIVHHVKEGSADLDPKLTANAERRVKAWREAGRLPFPDMSKEQLEELEGTLDYPPEGSHAYVPPDPEDNKP